jgi:multidrug resistance efflux pump
MTTASTSTDWTREDVAAAEENLRQAQAEVDRLRAKLAEAEATKDAHGVGAEPTVAEAGRAEARRRIAARSD